MVNLKYANGGHLSPFFHRTVDLNVWNRLKDIEETAALKYTWAASATSRQLLAAIAVDPRNMVSNIMLHTASLWFRFIVGEPTYTLV